MPKVFWDWLQANSAQLQALSSLIQVIGFPVVIIGIFLAYNQLRATADQVRYAASQTQGATVQDTARASRELFMKVWDDAGLRPILDPSIKNTDPARVDAFMGVLINHFATIYRQWKLGNIPEDYWEEVERDAKGFFNSSEVKERWLKVRRFYREDFQKFVNGLVTP